MVFSVEVQGVDGDDLIGATQQASFHHDICHLPGLNIHHHMEQGTNLFTLRVQDIHACCKTHHTPPCHQNNPPSRLGTL